MKKSANLVIIGAGIAGCSAAYHLAKLNWKDIFVIDQGNLFHTGGSTSHAPGTLFQLNPSKMMTELSKYTHELYDGFSVNGINAVDRVGSLQLAHTNERLEDFKRLNTLSKSYDLETDVLSADETIKLLPILSKENLKGSLHTPSDATGRAVVAAEAMANYVIASRAGEFQGGVIVEGFNIQKNQIRGVITNQGEISCDKVLVCGGIWGPKLGDMVGMNIPLQPLQHLYSKTNVITELNEFSDNGKIEITLPSLRAQDHGCYYRQHFNTWGIGNYNHDPISMSSHDLLPYNPTKMMPAIRDFTPEYNTEAEEATFSMFPCTKGKGYSDQFNGVFSFLPDGFPLIGESSIIKGLWTCEAVWIMHSGGAGKAVAEWMDQGRPSCDLHEADINRFNDFQSRKKYVQVTSEQSYREVHDIIHPHQPMVYPTKLRRSPFYDAMKAKGAVFYSANGWDRPQWYESNLNLGYKSTLAPRKNWESQFWSPAQIQEHLAVRDKAGLFDISAFTKFQVEGSDALNFLQKICVNNLDVNINSVVYTSLVNQYGNIECDFTITRLDEQKFIIFCGAGSGARDLAWIKQNIVSENVYISDLTSNYCGLGLWGPNAPSILKKITDEVITNENFPYYTARNITINFVPVLALRISYVGEVGWELYCPPEFGQQLFESIIEAGEECDLILAGNGCMDSLRMEKSYKAMGSDLNADYNLLEAGLGWTMRTHKTVNFIGKSALEKIKSIGISKKLVTLELMTNNRYPLGKEPIFYGNKTVGYISSTNSGYSVGKHLLFAYLPLELSKIGTNLEMEYFGEKLAVKVIDTVQYDAKNSKLKSFV